MDLNTEKYPEFEENQVSTKTIIANINIEFDIKKLFESLPLTNFTFVKKKRGRKKKNENAKPPPALKEGSIITLKFEDKVRGVETKKSSNKKRSKTYFRNSLTVVMDIKGKRINFKISKNGKFQITGCKTDLHAELCVKHIWNYIKDKEGDLYKKRADNVEIMFAPAMRNIDFKLGFLIDRQALAKYINVNTEYYAMLESSFGYTGVNLKIPMEDDITKLKIKKIIYKDDTWVETDTFYKEYLETFPLKEQKKKLAKKRYITFLAFHSGRIICSAMHKEFTIEPYKNFIQIIKDSRHIIEEKLDV